MDDQSNRDAVLRRVQKLLAIAQDSRADPNEAAAAAGQAEKIMRRYQIDNADLLAAELKARPGASLDRATVVANMKKGDKKRPALKKVPPWAAWLSASIAKLNDCERRYNFVLREGTNIRDIGITFYGFKADVEVSVWMFDYLVDCLIAGTKKFNAECSRDKVESASFRLGFVIAVCSKLDKASEEKAKELAALSASRALLVVKSNAIAETFGEFTYGQAKQSRADVDREAFHVGREAGSRVDVNRRGIGNSGGNVRGLLN